MRFSEREGFKPARAIFQLNSIDQALKNSLWNAVDTFVVEPVRMRLHIHKYQKFANSLWIDFYKNALDQMPRDGIGFGGVIRLAFFTCQWHQIYDFIEFILTSCPLPSKEMDQFRGMTNVYLEREMSAWRIVGNQLARLVSEDEIAAIEEAEKVTDEYAAVATHIRRSLELLSDRKAPDYRNSIKEAISAVESMCSIVTGNPKGTLGDTFKQLEKDGAKLHPALRESFSKLYGYTSDAQGIRHALMEQPTLDFDDAKYMLVSCSAFVNLLKARQRV